MREHDEWRSIPIVVLTAHDLSSEERLRLNGFVEKILPKEEGDSREVLLHEVRDLLAECTGPRRTARTEPKEGKSARQPTERSGVMSNAFHNAMPKILLVEDNEMNRDMLSRRLERKGYQVVLAVDGQSGVELAQTESPDLILMDMSLPILDGWEATRQLKADPRRSRIPIIALTAHAMAGDRERASRPAATITTPSRSTSPPVGEDRGVAPAVAHWRQHSTAGDRENVRLIVPIRGIEPRRKVSIVLRVQRPRLEWESRRREGCRL